jgi:hypothetical protein
MFEAYSVAIRVSLINQTAAGLLNMSRDFAKAHGDVEKLERSILGIQQKLMAGGALAGAGLFGLSLIEKSLPYARDYAHQLAQMNAAGMKQVEIAQAITAAWDAAKTAPTSTATQNLAAIRELRMVFGDTKDAIANLVTVQRLQAILANTTDGHGGKMAGESAYTVAKALEMRGATRDPRQFNVESDMMVKAIIASGGKVSPQDFLSNIIYGRRAAYGWDPTFTYTILPTLIQEMKGSGGGGGRGPGNALMSAYAAVVGGTIPQKSLAVWDQLGLIDKSKVVWTKSHEMKGVKPGGISGADLFQSNPYAWAQQILLPALQSHGMNNPQQMRQTLQYLFPNRTASIMDQMVMQSWKFERDQRLIRGAGGLGMYQTLLKTDPVMAQAALKAQWQNVLAVIGYQLMPTLVSGALKLVGALRTLSGWMQHYPALTKTLVVGFAALSAAMAFGGVVILLSAAFDALALAGPVIAASIGLIAPAITGAIAAVTLFLSVPGAIGTAFAAVGAAISTIALPVTLVVAAIAGIGVAIYQVVKHWDASKGILENIKAEFAMFVHWIWDKVRWLLNMIPGVHIDGDQPAPSAPHGWAGPPRAAHAAAAPNGGWGGPSRFVQTPQGQARLQVHTQINLDGKKVADVVSTHQARAMGSTMIGSGRHDPAATLPPVAAGAGR